MFKRLSIILFATIAILTDLAAVEAPKGYSVEGVVLEAETQAPVIGAVVRIGSDYLWTTTDIDGAFSFVNVEKGGWTIEVSCLGYVSMAAELKVTGDIEGL